MTIRTQTSNVEQELDEASTTSDLQSSLRRPLEKYVAGTTLDLLGRKASTPEINGWVGQLFGGVSRNTLATCLLNSQEKREQWVKATYEKLMKRAPSFESIRFWCGLLSSGKTQEEVFAAMIASNEYLALNGPKNENFVKGLFRDVLDRRPQAGEVDSWIGLLDSGSASKMAVAFQFIVGDEFRTKLLKEWHWSYLQRHVDNENLEFGLDQLRQGHSYETVQAGILASREYFNRKLVS